jgi:hypothetical protein
MRGPVVVPVVNRQGVQGGLAATLARGSERRHDLPTKETRALFRLAVHLSRMAAHGDVRGARVGHMRPSYAAGVPLVGSHSTNTIRPM